MSVFLLAILFPYLQQSLCDNFSTINLPLEHIPYYFTSFPNIATKCKTDPECPYKPYTDVKKYWGYEYNHEWGLQYSVPHCPGDHKGWVRTKFDQQNTFYTQGDFGFLKQQLREMKVLCEPLFPDDSILECSDHLRYCRGRNIMINLTSLATRQEPIRYKMDVLSNGDIGGYCDLKKDEIDAQADHISALQSWGPEIRYFTKLEHRPIANGVCDVIIEKPTYVMKIDASKYLFLFQYNIL